MDAPWVPEPPPHGTTGTWWRLATRTTAATSSSPRGLATTSGLPSGEPAARAASAFQYVSVVYRSSTSGAVDTVPVGIAWRRSSRSLDVAPADTLTFELPGCFA